MTTYTSDKGSDFVEINASSKPKKSPKKTSALDKVKNVGSNTLDKMPNHTIRAGRTITRVGKMHDAGVSPETIASQLSSGSASGHKYKAEEIPPLITIYRDTKTRVPVNNKQASALIKDAHNGDD